jgi:hypothetical protein
MFGDWWSARLRLPLPPFVEEGCAALANEASLGGAEWRDAAARLRRVEHLRRRPPANSILPSSRRSCGGTSHPNLPPQDSAIAYERTEPKKIPSPLAGEGCGALASVSELRRSWMGGSAPTGARACQSAKMAPMHSVFQRLRAARLRRGPLTQLRLSSLRSLRLRSPLPRGERGLFLGCGLMCDCPAPQGGKGISL